MSQIIARFILFFSHPNIGNPVNRQSNGMLCKTKKNKEIENENKYMINKKGVKIHDDAFLHKRIDKEERKIDKDI